MSEAHAVQINEDQQPSKKDTQASFDALAVFLFELYRLEQQKQSVPKE